MGEWDKYEFRMTSGIERFHWSSTHSSMDRALAHILRSLHQCGLSRCMFVDVHFPMTSGTGTGTAGQPRSFSLTTHMPSSLGAGFGPNVSSMEALTMQQAGPSAVFDPYAEASSKKPTADSTTGHDSTPVEAPSRPQSRKRILVSRPAYPVIQDVGKRVGVAPFWPMLVFSFSRHLGSLVVKNVV
jgi:hypothetical protein